MTLKEVLDAVAELDVGLVELTGGEPLLQSEAPSLLSSLCEAGYEVLLETGGHLDVSGLDPRVKRILDIKCPGSGEHEANRWANLAALGPGDEIKLVIADRDDFDWALARLAEHPVPAHCAILWSPAHGLCDGADLAAWMLDSGAPGRLQIQLHKVLWPTRDRGV